MNRYLIAAGILLTWATQLYGNSLWFGSSAIGFSDALSPAYEKLKKLAMRSEARVLSSAGSKMAFATSKAAAL